MENRRRPLRAAQLSWFVLAALGTATLSTGACSDDPLPPVPNPTVGGEGGEAPGAGGSAAAAAGTGAQASDTGEGGVAGMPPMPTPGEECVACGAAECKDELDSCVANSECSPWLECITACADEACVDACDTTHAAVARVYRGVYACLCDECDASCSVASSCDKQCVDDEALPSGSAVPNTLAETGLYAGYELPSGEGAGGAGAGGAEGAGGAPALEPGVDLLTLAPYVHLFEPKYPLWSDGAEKERHIYIPKCSTIDNSDPDHWEFPVGTRLWKRFTVPGSAAGGTRVETRVMHHFGPGEADWTFATYQWDLDAPDDPAMATLVDPAGVVGANGTTHDIPGVDQCRDCHTRLSERVLGFGSFQLSHDTAGDDVTIERISNLGWLTDPAPGGFLVPGTPVQQAALGYLHGNCGNCHNPSQMIGAGVPNDNTPLVLRLAASQTDYAATDTVTSSVGVKVASLLTAIADKPRIDPMAPDNSAILLRMQARGTVLQMPPLNTRGSKVADTAGGVADVITWVNSIEP